MAALSALKHFKWSLEKYECECECECKFKCKWSEMKAKADKILERQELIRKMGQ